MRASFTRTARTPSISLLIMELVVQGLSNDQIAGQLFPSLLTVKTHDSRAWLKLGARDRARLVVIAYQSGCGAGRQPDSLSDLLHLLGWSRCLRMRRPLLRARLLRA